MSGARDLQTSIIIDAPAQQIFELAAPVESWAAKLPHYRYVRVVADSDAGRTMDMAARRGCIPVSWQSIVRADTKVPRISFTHTGGFTRGMTVEWEFEPVGGSTMTTRVTIIHHVEQMASAVRRWLTHWFVGWLFIDPIARRTLARFKQLAEANP